MIAAIRKINFMTSFYKEEERPDFLDGITYDSGKCICKMDPDLSGLSTGKVIFSIRLVPSYFTIYTEKGKCSKILQKNWNYGVSLEGISSVKKYLDIQFNANGRKVILRNIKRLEACFNIRYELFYGAISDEEYFFLMASLKKMIERRFQEKKEISIDLENWEWLLHSSLIKIRNRTASLFVIFDGNTPVEISLNYHFQGILFSSVSSFDTDYSKFGPGQIEIYKQLEWCLNNGYHYFEMGVGGMEYKKRWSNDISPFAHYIVYSNSFIPGINGYLMVLGIRLKELIKSTRINDLIYYLISRLRKAFMPSVPVRKFVLKEAFEIDFDRSAINSLKPVILENHPFLKRATYEYLYLAQENISNISIYEVSPNTRFLLQGKKTVYELTYVDSKP